MFRTIGRSAVVLLVAATVAGALYLVVGPRGSAHVPVERRNRPDGAAFDGRFGHGRGQDWDDRSPGHGARHGEQDASLGRGVFGMAGTALQVGFVGAVVYGLQKRARRRGRRQQRGEGNSVRSVPEAEHFT